MRPAESLLRTDSADIETMFFLLPANAKRLLQSTKRLLQSTND
jgi:hypothetical protein